MRDPAKYNVSNVLPTQEDLDWAHKFLYPDMREPYRLIPHTSGKTDVVKLIATARAADRIERNDKPKEREVNQKEVDQAFEESEKAMNKMFSMMDEVFKPFKRFNSGIFYKSRK